jgi:hypothetical protein
MRKVGEIQPQQLPNLSNGSMFSSEPGRDARERQLFTIIRNTKSCKASPCKRGSSGYLPDTI